VADEPRHGRHPHARIELGVTGGEEDGVGSDDIDNAKLYTQPEDCLRAYEELSPIGHFSLAASFGNVHGVYAPGNVKLRPDILKNAQALAAELTGNGYRIVSGGTDNHVMLVDLRPNGLNGKVASETLDLAGITVNKNGIPFDTEKITLGGGIRLGTPAVTTRGMREPEMKLIADWIHQALVNRDDPAKLAAIKLEVAKANEQFPLP
jgi:glycine/serine hydroxymethyltransferase